MAPAHRAFLMTLTRILRPSQLKRFSLSEHVRFGVIDVGDRGHPMVKGASGRSARLKLVVVVVVVR